MWVCLFRLSPQNPVPKCEKGNNKCVGPNLMETTIEKVRVVERFSFGWPVFSSDSENSHYGTGVSHLQQNFKRSVYYHGFIYGNFAKHGCTVEAQGFSNSKEVFLYCFQRDISYKARWDFCFRRCFNCLICEETSVNFFTPSISLSPYEFSILHKHPIYTYIIVYIRILCCSRHDIGLSHLMSVF